MHVHPDPTSWARSTGPTCRSPRPRAPSRGPRRLRRPPGSPGGDAAPRAPPTAQTSSPSRCPATSRWPTSSRSSELLPEDGIVTNGAGNFAAFVHRYFQYKSYRTLSRRRRAPWATGCPAAIAAKLAHPTRPWSACGRRRLPHDRPGAGHGRTIRAADHHHIANNGMYGTIRSTRSGNTRAASSAPTLVNPDFAAYAESSAPRRHGGADGRLRGRLPARRRPGKPAVIDLARPGGDPPALHDRRPSCFCLGFGHGQRIRIHNHRRSRREGLGGRTRLQWSRNLEREVHSDLRDRGGQGEETRSAPCGASTLPNGAHLREQLLAHSDRDRFYTYNFLKHPFEGVENYVCTIHCSG